MKTIKYIYLLTGLLLLNACVEDRDLTYTGPTVVEFNNPITGFNEKLTGQSIGGGSAIGGNENIPVRGQQDSVVIQLVGPQLQEDLEVYYEIVPGTAQQGVDYSMIGNEGVAVIPANASATAIRFELLNTSADPNDIRTLSFQITGTSSENIGPSENYKTFEVSIFPMVAFVNRTLGAQGSTTGSYLSSRNGEVYTAAAAQPLVDIAYQVSEDGNETPMLISPNLILTAGEPDTQFSERVFAPTTDIPQNLQASYTTLQLNTVSSAVVSAIPTTGAGGGATVNSQIPVEVNGVYGFTNAEGKKGYIRVKALSPGTNGTITLDIMSQP